ncbi:MAG: insulinase family protein [Clostridia bacterium]|nr:insulinase family protein [Clostridia bacterium]
MKRILAMVLALGLLMTCFVAAAEQDEPALPGVGEVVYGFEVKEIREFPMIDAEIVRFEHQKTGAELYYIANDDTNRVFDLTFFTDAVDQTGLPHVFEHATLGGSEKYPSKSLFFNLSYQTYNTYMNAFTTDRMTSYPVASLSEAQLLKYADFYTDSCLHPMILQDEGIYREEAWRYRLADADSPLTIEGTVYSEMLGRMSVSTSAYKNSLGVTFPGSMIGNEEGGDPAYIPDMTWDTLKDYHDKYYHPSNCVAYLYGAFEDYAAFVKLLDDAFSPYEKREFTRSDDGYTPLTESVEISFPFPVEAGSATDTACVYYAMLCPGVEGEQEMLLNTLTDLLAAAGSPMQQKLLEAIPYGTFSCYIEEAGPEPAVLFILDGVDAEDAPLFRDTVNEALAEVAQNGFAQELVDAEMASLELTNRLMREDSSVGVESIIPGVAYNYAVSGNPWGYLEYVDALSMMDDWNKQGLYAKTAADWLLNPEITTLVTTYPEPGLKEQNDAAEAERLAAVKAAMTGEEIDAIVASSNGFEAEEDASAYIAQLQAVTVASLPEEVKDYAVTDETDEAGVRHIDAVAGVEGIGQANVFLDASGLPQEDIHWFKLYTDLIGELDTAAHTRAELATLTGRYLYNGAIRLSLMGEGDDYQPYLRMTWISTADDLEAGYDLVRELVYDSSVEDIDRLLEGISNIKASLKNSMTSAPYSVCLYRALGESSELYHYYSYINYIEYYSFLGEVEELCDAAPELVSAKLNEIKDYFNNSTGAVALFAGDEETIALNRTLSDAFLASLEKKPVERAAYDLPAAADAEALVIDNAVQFNGLVASYDALGMEAYDAGLDALTAVVSDTYLYPLLRDQYGAYGVFHGALSDGGVYVISYRDPNVAETFAVYAQLPELVGALEIDQETLDGYILSAYAGYAMPEGELSGAVSAAIDVMDTASATDKQAYMRELKAVTPEKIKEYAALYEKLVENGKVFTAGAASAIEANGELYEAVLNPFNAQDLTQVAFSDLTEEHEQYEAARFAYENGLMAPLSEDAFGVDEPATTGDVLTALYVLVGGDLTPDDALAFFAQYGMASADLDLDEVITASDAADTMASLAALMGMEWSADEAADEVMTRGDLAVMLDQFLTDLQG